MRDPVASVSRPVLELKGIEKVVLAPGQSKRVSLTLSTDDLKFLGAGFAPTLEAGAIEIFVGPSAKEETLLKAQLRVVL
jgi:beta-glucosidase